MPAKLYSINGGQVKHGNISTRHLDIKCLDCGNTTDFYGKAFVNPHIKIELAKPNQYQVTEISYISDGLVDEVVEFCAVCDSINICTNEVK